MTRKLEIDELVLKNLYLKQGLSTYQIAQKYNCWSTTISSHLKRYKIKIRNPKKALRPDRELLYDLYINKLLSPYKIAKQLDCSPSTIRNWIIEYNFYIRKKKLISISKKDLKRLYYDDRLSLNEIGKRFGYTASGLFGIFKKQGFILRTTSESSKYYSHRFNFNGSPTSRAYLIGFRIGDMHVRKNRHVIRVGFGTTKYDQVILFEELFNKFGHVYIGKKDKKGAWHPEVALNKSFTFLLPKHRKIPKWVFRSKKYFLSFLAGYSDAEANIGCYPRARFKIASYDYGILRDIGEGMKKYLKISPVFFLEKTNRKTHNQDALSVTINEMRALLKLLNILKPLLKHKNRLNCLNTTLENISDRLS